MFPKSTKLPKASRDLNPIGRELSNVHRHHEVANSGRRTIGLKSTSNVRVGDMIPGQGVGLHTLVAGERRID